MLKKALLLLSILVLFFACAPQKQKAEKPNPFITEEKMIDVLTDVHIIEGSRTGLTIMGDTVGIAVYYHKLFLKHNITKEGYQNNFDYYLKDPEHLDLMYEKVIENLTVLESEEPVTID